MDPKISIIIPVYNTEDYLEEALDSILNQSLCEIEVLCVNDGSTDRSGDILREYNKKDARVIPIFQENQGPSAARNNGIRRAAGKYIQFLDSDDLLAAPDVLESLYQKAEAEGLYQLFFDADSFYESEELKEAYPGYVDAYHRKEDYPECRTGRKLFAQMQDGWDFKISPVLQLLRRDFLLEHNLEFCESMRNHEDEVFSLECSILSPKSGYLKRSLYKRRVRDGSQVTDTQLVNHVKDCFRGVEQLTAFAGEHILEEDADVCEAFFERILLLQEMAGRYSAQADPEQKREWLRSADSEQRAVFAASLKVSESLQAKQNVILRMRDRVGQLEENLAFSREQNSKLKEQNSKLKEEKSELKLKLQRGNERRAELNNKLQQTYQEKAERGERIKELEQQVYDLQHPIKHMAKKVSGRDGQ